MECQSPIQFSTSGNRFSSCVVLVLYIVFLHKFAIEGTACKLTLEDVFLMIIMTLRLGLLEHDIADHFGFIQTAMSQILDNWIPMMAQKLKRFMVMPKTEV